MLIFIQYFNFQMMGVSREDFRKRFCTKMTADIDCIVASIWQWSKHRPALAFFCAMFLICCVPPCFVALFFVFMTFLISVSSLVFVQSVIMIVASLIIVMTIMFALFQACCSSVGFFLLMKFFKFLADNVAVK